MSRGSMLVVLLVLAGFVAGGVAVSYWSTQIGGSAGNQNKGAPIGPAGSLVGGADGGAGSAPFHDEQARKTVEALEEQVMGAIEQHRGDLVMGDVEKVVELYPKYPPARTMLAQLLLDAGKFEQALEQIKLSLDLDPRQAELRVLAGTVAQKLGRMDEAQRHYSLAIELDPKQARYRLHLAQLYLSQKELDRARDVLLKAILINSSEHKAYAMLARVYLQQNKASLALDQLQKAIEATPGSERAAQIGYLREKAACLRRANRAEEALLVLQQSLTAKERLELVVLDDMALCRAMMGRFVEAAELFEQLLEQDPGDFEAAGRAARWRIKAGDLEVARKHVELIKKLRPRWRGLEEIEAELGRVESAPDSGRG